MNINNEREKRNDDGAVEDAHTHRIFYTYHSQVKQVSTRVRTRWIERDIAVVFVPHCIHAHTRRGAVFSCARVSLTHTRITNYGRTPSSMSPRASKGPSGCWWVLVVGDAANTNNVRRACAWWTASSHIHVTFGKTASASRHGHLVLKCSSKHTGRAGGRPPATAHTST